MQSFTFLKRKVEKVLRRPPCGISGGLHRKQSRDTGKPGTLLILLNLYQIGNSLNCCNKETPKYSSSKRQYFYYPDVCVCVWQDWQAVWNSEANQRPRIFLSCCSFPQSIVFMLQGKSWFTVLPSHISVARKKKGRVEGMKLILKQGLTISALLTFDS